MWHYCVYSWKCIQVQSSDSRAIGKESKTHKCLKRDQVATNKILECAYLFCYDTVK